MSKAKFQNDCPYFVDGVGLVTCVLLENCLTTQDITSLCRERLRTGAQESDESKLSVSPKNQEPNLGTRTLLGAAGIATRSKDATRGPWHRN